MNLSVCTISFRHQLISLDQITRWANAHGFQSIELWGVHAKNLRDFPQYNLPWMKTQNLTVSMLSDYLPLDGDESIAIRKMMDLCELARFWGVNKIRTFAGNKASSISEKNERKLWTQRLRKLCDVAAEQDIFLVVETHPNTLADTLESTLALLNDTNHNHLKINFDVIHLWEAGDDPKQAFTLLAPYVNHMHLKNISHRTLLDHFKPANVYAPTGSREGMVGVLEGAFDFQTFLRFLMRQKQLDWQTLDVSLEWFGENVLHTLSKDKQAIEALQGQYAVPMTQSNEQGVAV